MIDQKMNPEVKAKLVAALRSGEYQQTKNSLRTADGFCCLGVLCDIYSKENPDSYGTKWDSYQYWSGLTSQPEPINRFKFMNEECLTPHAIVEWAGLQDMLGSQIEIDGETRYMANHNDNGATFEQLANAIEEQL